MTERKNTFPSDEVPTELGPKILTSGAKRLIANNFDRGENPGRKEKERVIPMTLVDAYREWAEVLPKEDQDEKTEMIPGGVFTQIGLVDHLLAEDEIGRGAFNTFIENSMDRFEERGEEASDEQVLEEIVSSFKADAEKLRQGDYER